MRLGLFAFAPALLAAGCPAQPFAVDLTVEIGSVPVPDHVDFNVMELSGGATLDTRELTVLGADFFAAPGESNRLLVIAGDGADTVGITGIARDAADATIGMGNIDVPRESGTVTATLTLMPLGGTDAGSDGGVDGGGSDGGSVCGDGVMGGGEACDDTDLGGATCASLGFVAGTLACYGDCSLNTSGCSTCGDDTVDAGEDCDGSDLGGNNCTTLGQGWVGGTLGCAGDCSFDTSACVPPANCGNGIIEGTEDCDGAVLGGTCASATAGALPSGTLACAGGCVWDTSGCYNCGDGTIDGLEVCDGSALGSETCITLLHDGGSLACAAGCLSFDETGCTDCGDGVAEGTEACDGSDLGGNDCTSAGMYSGGTLACTVGCTFDTFACDGPPSVPVNRRPLNNAYVGSALVTDSRRPTFAWEPSTIGNGAPITYELQWAEDAGFTTSVVTVPAGMATTHTPSTDMNSNLIPPVGARHYWHVRACAGSACSAWSDTWRVNVGRSDHDLNGDGYADMVIGAYNYSAGGPTGFGRAVVLFGGATFDSSIDGQPEAAALLDQFGFSVSTGDVNGDGFADLVVGAPTNDLSAMNAGAAYVYFGGAGSSLDIVADATLTGAAASDLFGQVVSAAGDLNADGYADVVVGAYANDAGGAGAGQVYVYFGSAGAFDTGADGILTGTAGDFFGLYVAARGDVDGDGYGDVLVGAPYADPPSGIEAGRTHLYLGGPGATFDATPDATLDGESAGDHFGIRLALGDLNADGFSDVVVGAPSNAGGGVDAGRVYAYFGGAGAFDATADGIISGTVADDRLGTGLGAGGDVNGDGFGDLVVGAPGRNGCAADAGYVNVYFGGAGASFDTVSDGSPGYAFPCNPQAFGRAVAIGGDVNGDAIADVLVGSPLYTPNGFDWWGRFYLYYGGSGVGFDAGADGLLDPANEFEELGVSVW